MKLFKNSFLAFGVVFLAVLCSHAKSIENKVYDWLLNQQNHNTGLLGNQEEDSFSGIYSNALAAICFTHKGDTERAEKIFDFFQNNYNSAFSSGSPKGFHQFADAASGAIHRDTDRWVGDVAWLLIALNFYENKTKSENYNEMRKGIAQWIISLQDEDGGIKAGFNKNGAMNHKSTEGNLDCFAALVHYPSQRGKILKYLQEKMWVEKEKRFRMGSTVDETALDCCAWAIAALGKEYKNTIDYMEEKFLRTAVSDANGKTITGFADFLDKKKVWLEGTGEMTVAYHVAGEKRKAKKYLNQLEKAMVKSALFKETVGLPCSTNDPSWDGASKKIFVPAQCWYLLGRWKLNPMETDLEQKP